MNLEMLNNISMKILTLSGNAKKKLTDALTLAETDCDSKKVNSLLEEAHVLLVNAHVEQNKVIAEVETLEYSVLFTHAQDTLANTETIEFLTRHLIKLTK
ncbi:PTS lactose/cellobiose transporter subunit IIA [Lentilactobacillus sp. Marseille-Q4993]|uniref:PTS lactose/cellobiose transporter subunit IIA n=1 Tax=Lentilactobacillus sp. Marseille-Q4993 TaxID=3039492 RepID=UPI0024BC4676|nr:PTS lactose/cellobiose transporter subunit IIA [Lentilactobacillus sp. Marseille-Q4993]